MYKRVYSTATSTLTKYNSASQEQKEIRELLVNVMNIEPSKKEIQHFLRRFDKQVQEMDVPFSEVAVTKIECLFDKNDWQTIGNTLYHLQHLGLSSIVVLDNPNWYKNIPHNSTKQIVLESMSFVESIEQIKNRTQLIYNAVLKNSSNIIDIQLDFILSGLNKNQIPIILPILTKGDGRVQVIKANQIIHALVHRLQAKSDPKFIPSKIIVINKEGGVPNHRLPGTAHSLIIVQDEYEDIRSAFQVNKNWKHESMEDLTMIKDCLEQLPTESSGIIASVESLPSALITNLITDKPLYTSSLPIKYSNQINQTKTTVVRDGIKIHEHDHLNNLNMKRLTNLLEASFKKKLDIKLYYDRISNVLNKVIIAGDYEGVAIVTNESSHAYLDKFAIAPSSQGIGLTDVLWKRMCDHYPELFWRSRKANGVNKWYFERSDGCLCLKDTDWILFWHGLYGFKHPQEYAKIVNVIPPSFL